MAGSDFDQDDLVLQELKMQNIEGLTPRGRLAVQELAGENHGAAIFLILSLNSRIRELEHTVHKFEREGTKH